ncbi:hypothetical protein R8Z50_10880 [Longispora sp. K20-0274]|uniref:hypothetical protein n=1 Tax=Longispora sp. K20-0274 TaxID=3088255 RepID=UPI00399A58BC
MIRRVMALRRLRLFIAALAVAVASVLTLGASPASAHNWGSWHWDKTGSSIVINNYIYGGTTAQAEAARQNGWNTIGILYNYSVNTHTDVSVFDGNFGATGWAGLASLESVSGDHILHGHARYNSYYGGSSVYIQGVYCQEIFHTYGFDHSDTGDCMGLGYYASGTSYYGPHNNTDFFNRYRYH